MPAAITQRNLKGDVEASQDVLYTENDELPLAPTRADGAVAVIIDRGDAAKVDSEGLRGLNVRENASSHPGVDGRMISSCERSS